MSNISYLIKYFKFQNRLKTVFRNNWTLEKRKESSAEHSWSVAIMVWLLSEQIEKELTTQINLEKAMKMALIHDIVEIEAGDIAAWDLEGRKKIQKNEHQAIKNINEKYSMNEIYNLWVEHEKLLTIEAKLVKACDQMCPLIYRLVFNNAYEKNKMDRSKLDQIFLPLVSFSKTTLEMYNEIAEEMQKNHLFT